MTVTDNREPLDLTPILRRHENWTFVCGPRPVFGAASPAFVEFYENAPEDVATLAAEVVRLHKEERYLRVLDQVVSGLLAEQPGYDDEARRIGDGEPSEDGVYEYGRLRGHVEARRVLAHRIAEALAKEGIDRD